MRSTRRAAGALFDNPILIGTVTILVVVIAVYLSYIAENGLPFVPAYNISVDVQNAGQLIKNADVRIGGARVGQVLTITPEPATKTWPHPFARLGLVLQRGLQPLPMDTHYGVRVASVLGGNDLEIVPGHRRGRGLPDGGTFTLDTRARLSHDLPFVDLDTALATVGPRTRIGLRGSLAALGDAVAGRGAQINDSIGALRALTAPLQNLLGLLSAPSTRLPQFVSGLGATTGALAPVAPALDALLAGSATTFRALDRPALAATLDQLPATESLSTTVLRHSEPVLAEAARIAVALRPGAALLPIASRRLDRIVTAGTPLFRQAPRLAVGLRGAAAAVDTLARDPAATDTFTVLGSNDLGTLGSSAFLGLGAILRTVSSAQFACNVAGVWVRNFASGLSEGDRTGGWLRFSPLLDVAQTFQANTPASDLHLNYYPIENASQCQAGNEVYGAARQIGSPPLTSRTVDATAPPAGVLQRATRVGLVP